MISSQTQHSHNTSKHTVWKRVAPESRGGQRGDEEVEPLESERAQHLVALQTTFSTACEVVCAPRLSHDAYASGALARSSDQ